MRILYVVFAFLFVVVLFMFDQKMNSPREERKFGEFRYFYFVSDSCINYSMNLWEEPEMRKYIDEYNEAGITPEDGVIFNYGLGIWPSDSVEIVETLEYQNHKYHLVNMRYQKGGRNQSRRVYVLADHAHLSPPVGLNECTDYLNGCYVVELDKGRLSTSLCN